MSSLLHTFSQNWRAGLTVALVSIPLSVSLAIASHATPVAGIITAIWAGLSTSLVGSSNYDVVGPTGALSGLIASCSMSHGCGSLPTLALVSGLIIFIIYALKLERYIHYIPEGVIYGFMLGVACIIMLNQINFACGLHGLPTHEKLIWNIWESLNHITALSWSSISIFGAFTIALFIIQYKFPYIPGIIVLTPLGIVLGYCAQINIIPISCATLQTTFGPIVMKLGELPTLQFSSALVFSGIAVALIAIIETLLSAKIADRITKTHHNARQEIVGLAVANIVSGLIGGMPATAALARTSLNIKSGATSKMAQGLSSIFIALISVLLLPWFSYMPEAVIAAILVFIAVRMIEREHFSLLYQHDKKSFCLAMIVALLCIVFDPMIGIVGGTAIFYAL